MSTDHEGHPEYQAGRAERCKVERSFGEANPWHGIGRCRYLGLLRCGLQAHLTALVLSLKRIVLLLTGVRLGPTQWLAPVQVAYPLGFVAPADGRHAPRQAAKARIGSLHALNASRDRHFSLQGPLCTYPAALSRTLVLA